MSSSRKRQDIKIKTEQEVDEILARLMPEEKKVKIEEDTPRLSKDSVSARLALINYAVHIIELDESIRNTTVSRHFMTNYYGGNTQSTFPDIARSRSDQHGLTDFMYVNLNLNPYAPKVPGDSGLWFNPGVAGDNIEWPGIWRVFVRLASSKWLYVGQYKMIPAPPLTIDEWKSQSEAMKRGWAEKLHHGDWARGIRAVIWLWQTRGRKPTEEETDDALASKDKYANVSEGDIRRAFDEGQIVFCVWCMKCISYAEDFQRYIAREYAHWVPPPPKAKKATKKKLSTSTSPKKSKAGQKRRREQSEDRSPSPFMSLPLESEEEEDMGEARHGRQYIPRGTRSRPDSMKSRVEESGSPIY
ncbi:hypothetical protein NEOLEDRAFT_1136835 [Neolentinus lepideus HHB14362 ss-1]|uniref:DUF6697 domain-containing protein n=1 Tax=Neolentinus lepideus HHB14362 ss-1 TaxID=1314782 RepID=A0A165R2D0_9AGAM|nr:hypothetical protein NEOLEDRAFT_1136835 [Neolentinus lepideus HHB14362 ss-1]